MGKSVNSIVASGNLGKDPEVTYSGAGLAVCKFSLAVNDRKKEGDSWKDVTVWLRVTCFGKTAENAGQYLAKGKGCIVSGKLEVDNYVDKQGKERTSVGVVANEVVFMGGGGGGEGAAPKPAESKPAERFIGGVSIDDDLPL